DRVWLLGTSLYVSIDGGKTFTNDSVARGVHPDHHALWIDPAQPEHMLLGNDGGVFFSYDGARSWDFVDNLPIGQFYDIAIDAREPYWIYGGLQDQGTFGFPSGTYSRGPLLDNQVTFLEYGDGFQVATDPTNPRLIYANSQNGRGYVVDLETHEERRITPVPVDRGERYRFNWNTAILVSPNDPRVYYYGANKLLKTMDHGTTWDVLSPDLTRHQEWRKLTLGADIPDRDSTTLSRDDGTSQYGNITTIAEVPGKLGTIYVGTDDGNVQLTTDGGAHWTDITARFHLSTRPSVSKVIASRHDAATAYATFDGHTDDDMKPYVFKSVDNGATWRSIAGDLPLDAPVRTLTEDPRNANLLFAGTEFGLYWSLDGGRHWSFPGGNLPRVSVSRVLVNERNNDLILGTHGRSVIVLDDIRALESAPPVSTERPIALAPLRDATLVYQWRDQPFTAARKFTAPNAPVGVLVTYRLRANADAVRIQVATPDGTIVRELHGPTTAGVHRVLWDLRSQLAFVPPPRDSGFYGAPRAPLVTPGMYTVTLTALDASVSEVVRVRANPRSMLSPEVLATRQLVFTRADSLTRVFAVGRAQLASIDTEFVHLRALLAHRRTQSATDSAVTAVVSEVAAQLAILRRALASDYGTPIGQVHDVIAGLDSHGFPPGQFEQRTLDAASADIAASTAKLQALAEHQMPMLRAAVASSAPMMAK
ncbi:MAG: hypothetical protein ABJE10_08235, partial [bacterium]